jgi:ABC-type Zn uptake system ZnuABC Zn-binding protein ZnuA
MRVESIVPAGAHVEEYEPRPADGRRVSQARLFFVNGLDLDTWAQRLLGDRRADAPVVTLSDGLPTIGDNPHLWFDVSLARRYVEKIRDALAGSDADGASVYAANADRYERELTSLDADVRAAIATIPAERRKLVTSHDAYPYFANAYGLTIVGYSQIEAGKDPPPAQLADLIEKTKAAHVPALFSEAGVSPRIVEMIASESGVTKIVTDMPTDSLMAAPADSYVGVMRTIANKIADALR